MAFNRLIDQEIDAKNPRTMGRPLQKGIVTSYQVRAVAWGGVGLFVVACGMLNPLCLSLSPLAVFLFWVYSYTKRLTPYCHFVLGLVQLMGPLFAWIAITGEFSMAALLIGCAVFASIAASDIIYAFQDEAFDRTEGLFSIPARLGRNKSIWIVRGLHLFALAALVSAGISLQVGPIYFAGVAVIALIYLYEQLQMGGPDQFLFRCNTRVALTFLATTLAVLLWQKLL